MKKKKIILVLSFAFGVLFGLIEASPALANDEPSPNAKPAGTPSGALVLFLTTDDPMSAGHALHFAEHTFSNGRPVTIILVGNAGKLALKNNNLPPSPITGEELNKKLQQLVEKKVTVIITPYTLAALGQPLENLIPEITPPKNGPATHAHIWEPETKIVVW
ncbi:MAG: DsrE family protein [Verrucomicrobia bacterium]|nr:DsrE family protein [Verrucomicrobiota bacterium]